MDFDIESLLEAVGLQNNRQAQIASQVTGNNEQMKQLGDARAQSAVVAGENDEIVQRQKLSGELHSQQNARKFATAAGTNMDDNAEIMTTLGMQYKQAAAGAIAATKELQNKSSVSFLDSPVDFIVNTISRPWDEQKVNDAQSVADTLSQRMAQLNQATQQTVVTQNAIAETKTAASIESELQNVKLKAADQAAQIKIQNLQYNTDGLKAVAALDQNQLANLFSANSAIVQQKHLAIAQAQLAETMKMHQIAISERAEKLKEKQESLDETKQLGDTINAGRAALGLPEIPAGKSIQMMKMGGEIGEQIKHQYTIGATNESTGVQVVADTPGKAALVVAQTGAPLAPAMAPVKKLLMQTVSDVMGGRVKDANGMIPNLKDRNSVTAALDSQLKLVTSNQARMIKPGDATNIYAAPDFDSIAKITPAITQTALYQKVLGPAINTGMKDVDPDRVLSLTTAALKSGQININEATSGIATLFAGAVTTNNATKDYVRVGLNKQAGYNTSVTLHNINTVSGLGAATDVHMPVNLADQTAVSRVISKNLAMQTKKDLFQNVTRADFAFGPEITFPKGQ